MNPFDRRRRWRRRRACPRAAPRRRRYHGVGAAHHAPAWAPAAARADGGVEQRTGYLGRQRGLLESLRPPDFGDGVFIAVIVVDFDALSTAADALSDAVFAPAALARVRTADRAVGSTALVASVVANSLSAGHHGVCHACALSAVSVRARAPSRAPSRSVGPHTCAYRPGTTLWSVRRGRSLYRDVVSAASRFATVASNANSPRPPAAARRRAVVATRLVLSATPIKSTAAANTADLARSGRPPRCAQRRPAAAQDRDGARRADALAAARPSSAGKRFPGDLLEPLGGRRRRRSRPPLPTPPRRRLPPPPPPPTRCAAARRASRASSACSRCRRCQRRRSALSPLPPAPPPAAAAVSEAWAAAPPTAYPTAEEEAAAEAAEAAEWELRCCFRVLRAWRREASSAALARTKAALLHRIWLGLLRFASTARGAPS